MKYNVLHEIDNYIVTCMNRGGVSTEDIAGGSIIIEGTYHDDEVKNVLPFATGTKMIGIVYSPSANFTIINDELYAPVSDDDRNYTNAKGKTLDYFFPKTNVEFGILGYGIEGATMPIVGDILVPTDGKYTFSIGAVATDVPAFEVVRIFQQKYPSGKLGGQNYEPVYVLRTIQNG